MVLRIEGAWERSYGPGHPLEPSWPENKQSLPDVISQLALICFLRRFKMFEVLRVMS
jgi:hypothetical protein